MYFKQQISFLKQVRCVLLVLFVVMHSIVSAQITINRFASNLTYFPGAGISVSIVPQGVFDLNSNKFILELSNSTGSFNTPTVLAEVTDFYTPIINGVIPNSTPPGAGYKIRVRSIQPVYTVESNVFTIASAPGLNFTVPSLSITSTIYTDLINCVGSGTGYFGFLKRDASNTTLNIDCQINSYDAQFSYTVNFIDRFSTPGSTSVSSLPHFSGAFNTPDGKPIGHYPIEIIKTHTPSGTSSVFSTLYLFHTGNTGMGSLSSDFICVGDTVFFIVNQIATNYPGSKYSIEYGDGTSATQWKSHAEFLANDTLSYVYQTATCASPAGLINGGRRSYRAQLNLWNKGLASDCINFTQNGNGVTKWVNASKAPMANFTAPTRSCVTSAITCTNTSTPGQFGITNTCASAFNSSWAVQWPGSTNYTSAVSSWISNGNLTIPSSVIQQYGAGCWKVRLRVSNNTTEGCTRISEIEKTIKVESPLTANFDIINNGQSVTSICFGQTVTLQDLSSSTGPCKESTYNWSITSSVINGFTYVQPTNAFSQSPQVVFNTPGTYNITQNISNGCGLMTPVTKTLLVLGNPTATFNPTSQSICTGSPASVDIDFLQVPYRPTYSASPFLPSTYSWTVGGSGVTVADYEFVGGTTSSDAFPKIRLKAYKTFQITVTVNGSCGNTSSSGTISITVKQTPLVTNTNLSQTICSGTSFTTVNLTADLPSPTFTWTAAAIPAGSVSGFSNGNGLTLSGQTLTSNSTSVSQVVYSVAAIVNGCTGPTTDFTISIDPSPRVIFNPAGNQSLCSGGSSTLVNLTTLTSGTSINWTSSTPAGISGALTSGTTTIPSQTLVNSTNAAIAIDYVATVSSNTQLACPGVPSTLRITVNPKPVVTATPSSTSICTGSSTSISLSSTTAWSNTSYTWTVSAPTGITGASGGSFTAQNNPRIVQTLSNSTTGTLTVTYTVTPTFQSGSTSCQGDPITIQVQVYPRPTISNSPLSQSVCSGGITTPVSLTSPVDGATFSWVSTASSGVTGHASSGTITIPQQTLSNSGNTNGTVTYSLTPSANGCTGTSSNYIITVYPVSRVTNTVLTQTICSGTSSSAVTLSSNVAGSSFTWTSVAGTEISGNSSSGTSIIPAQTLTNSSLGTSVVTYTIIPSNNNCAGPSTDYSIQVRPVAQTTFSESPQTICSGATTVSVLLSSNISGASFTWSSTIPTGIVGAISSGTSTIPVQTITNTTANPITITYIGRAAVGSAPSCLGPSANYTITIIPSPRVEFSTGNQTIASGSTSVLVNLTSPTSGTTINWTSTPPASITGSLLSGTNTIPPQTLVSSVNSPVSVVYSAIATTAGANACTGAPSNYTITVNPIPNVSANPNPQTICSGGATGITLSSTVSGTTYSWTVSTSGNINGASAGSGSTINQTLVNTSAQAQTATYTVIPSYNNGSLTTTGSPFPVVVTVNPSPSLSSSLTPSAICNESTFTYTATSLTPNTSFTWSRNNITGISETASSGSTSLISETLTNFTTSPITVPYQVVLTANGCIRTQTVNLVVNPDAKAQFNADALASCPPYSLQQHLTLTPYVNANIQNQFAWYANGNLIGTGASIPNYTISTPGQTVVIKLVAKSIYGCKNDSMSLTLSTVSAITPSFTISNDTACGPATVSFTNTSSPLNLAGSNYLWNFGNGQNSTATNPNPVVYLANASNRDTTYYITLTVTTNCQNSVYRDSILIRPRPKALFQPETTVACSPASIRFINNSLGRGFRYIWDWDDGTMDTVPDTRTLYHSFLTGVIDTFNVRLVAINECARDTFNVPILIRPASIAPSLIIAGPNTYGCAPKPVTFVNNSVGGTLYTINFGDGSAIYTTNSSLDTFTHIYSVAGTYTISMRSQNGCTDTTLSRQVVIHPSPLATFQLDKTIYCATDTVRITNNSTGGMVYTWNFGDGSSLLTGVTNPSHRYSAPGNYTITLIATNSFISGASCADTARRVANVTANSPAIFTSNVNNINCAPFTFYGYTTPTNYTSVNWYFLDSLNNYLGNSSGYNSSFNFNSPGYYRVRMISSNANGCLDSSTTSFRVTATPVASFIVPDTVYCAPSATVTFRNTSTYVGAERLTYEWQIDGTNYSTSDTTFTYTFTPPVGVNSPTVYRVRLSAKPVATGCSGYFEKQIIILPVGQVNQPLDITSCPGQSVNINFTNNLSGGSVIYNWANSISGIGLSSAGTGSIPTFVTTNQTNQPLTALINVTPTFTSLSKNCVGPSKSFQVTINPKGQVNQPADLIICHGQLTSVNYTTNNIRGVTTYSWTNDNPSIGIISNNTGNIATFYAINSTASPVVATIRVTPTYTYNGISCEGDTKTFTITVLPAPIVDQPASQVVCNGQTTTFTFGSPNTGGLISYRWVSNNSTIGLSANGVGNTTTFTATNSTNSPITATITVTPTFTFAGLSCDGVAKQFTITVNPSGQVNSTLNQVLCNGGLASGVRFSTIKTGGVTTFQWVNSQPSIGLSAFGVGDIDSFRVINNGVSPDTATIQVTPTFSNAGVSCSGPSSSFVIVVNPTAKVNQPINKQYCSGVRTQAISFTSTNLGGTVTYSWTNDTPSIGLAGTGTGTVPAFTATNLTASPVIATITVVPTFTNAGVSCSGPSKTFTITVLPVPQSRLRITPDSACAPMVVTFANLSQYADSFQWLLNNIQFSTDHTPPPMVLTQPGTTYTFTLIANNVLGGCGPVSASYVVKTLPTPRANFILNGSIADTIGACQQLSVTVSNTSYLNTVGNTVGLLYKWYINGILQPTVSAQPTFNFTNISPTRDSLIEVKMVVISSAGCIDSSKKWVRLYPRPYASFSINGGNTNCALPSNGLVKFVTNLSQVKQPGRYQWSVYNRTSASPNHGVQISSTTSINPSFVFPDNLSPSDTTYDIRLLVISPDGCSKDTTISMVVYARPIVNFRMTDSVSCSGSLSVSFLDLSLSPTSTITNRYWYFDDGGAFSTLPAVNYVYDHYGLYFPSLYVKNARACVSDTMRKRVIVFGSPTADFSTPNKICVGTSVPIMNSSQFGWGSTQFTQVMWDFGDGTTSTLLTPTHSYQLPGTYTITLSVKSDSSCVIATKSRTIIVMGKPKADFTFNSRCVNTSIQINNLTTIGVGEGGYGTVLWNFGNGQQSTLNNPTHIYSSTGTYTVSLIVGGISCPQLQDTISKTIIVNSPRPDSTYPLVFASKLQLHTLRALAGGVSYVWTPSIGLSHPTRAITDAYYLPGDPSKIFYTINIKDSSGCLIRDKQEVWVFEKPDVYAPTAFTPNKDGSNDLFIPFYINIKTLLSFRVFNRWGVCVFDTNNILEGWDGTIKGQRAPLETYSWTVECYDVNGKKIVRKGMVSLLRY
jgi:gliding motility-associated-like protein